MENNVIIILKSPVDNGKFEFRVAAAYIEDSVLELTNNVDKKRKLFGKSKVHNSKEFALGEALDLEDSYLDKNLSLDFGIVTVVDKEKFSLLITD